MHFIYVLNEESKEKMESMGYRLIKADASGTVWVFANKDNFTFGVDSDVDEAGVSYILSDTLVF